MKGTNRILPRTARAVDCRTGTSEYRIARHCGDIAAILPKSWDTVAGIGVTVMRKPIVIRPRAARSVALTRRRDADTTTKSTQLRLALEFVTLLILGWAAIYAAVPAGHY
jgi:hypothetical protein